MQQFFHCGIDILHDLTWFSLQLDQDRSGREVFIQNTAVGLTLAAHAQTLAADHPIFFQPVFRYFMPETAGALPVEFVDLRTAFFVVVCHGIVSLWMLVFTVLPLQ